MHFIPVYVCDRAMKFQGRIEDRIKKAFEEQYVNATIGDYNRKKIIPIIDDFYVAQNKEKHLDVLSIYDQVILIVDDIFNLDFRDENLLAEFNHFKIEELNPLLRDQLIRKWVTLKDGGILPEQSGNQFYKSIDERTEVIDATIGKVFGKGIMPAYPFFLLSIISTYEAFSKPLDQDITSQGYCYQAFIYMYLRKQGVKNDEIDTYINFLSEFAFLFFSEEKEEISNLEFDKFMTRYLEKFNMPVSQDILLGNLNKSGLIIDSFNNYSFRHRYMYFFFVAKYLDIPHHFSQ